MREKSRLYIASQQDILDARVTDVYFDRTKTILQSENIHKKVVMECTIKSIPKPYKWGVFTGLEDVITLLENKPVNVWSVPEGTFFHEHEPVLIIEGDYTKFGCYETSILGMLCQATGVATKASRCKLAAQGRPVYSFGARRMHPAIAPLIDKSAYLGGCDGVAAVKSAEMLGLDPVGTIPHTLVLLKGDTIESARSFDELMPDSIPRVVLIDTFNDEKFEAIRVAEQLKRVDALRLDTPGSRRGDFLNLLKEVRWELDMRGYKDIKLFASGGLDEYSIMNLNEIADAYGVGTSISNAPVFDFAMDIVEIEGEPLAKRGKMGGRKTLLQKNDGKQRIIHPSQAKKPKGYKEVLIPIIQDGNVITDLPTVSGIREKILKVLGTLSVTDEITV
ncbi:MAG: nicotinate phosphoribosyltransferase [candidate division KSB1 bacterium]|nr:nicotinate phosphoribosyltransferase [candidate division KSB1 bacterium]